MWMIFPAAGLVALIALVGFLRSEAGRERRRGMIVVAIAAALLAVGGMALLGIPGALIYELCVPWVRLMPGGGFRGAGRRRLAGGHRHHAHLAGVARRG